MSNPSSRSNRASHSVTEHLEKCQSNPPNDGEGSGSISKKIDKTDSPPIPRSFAELHSIRTAYRRAEI